MNKRFRPSQAGYWSKCAAFQRLTSDLPEQESGDAAREGTCAAWVADVVLMDSDGMTCSDLIGEAHENGWLVTSEIAADVQLYVNLVRSYGGEVVAEEYVTASEKPLIAGSLDSSIVSSGNGILRIIDLKYGRRIVETTAAQLLCYGFGKLLKVPTFPNPVKEIHLSIYQPRAFHKDGIYRTRVLTVDQLTSEYTELWNMAVEGEKPDSMATAGPHCADCEAASGCVTLAQTTYNLIHHVNSREHRNMTPLEISRELDMMEQCEKTINARFKAVKSEAEARAKHESIPGWSQSTKKGNSVFTVSGVTLNLLTGIDPYEKKLCTPAELLRRGATEEQLKSLTERPETGRKLTRMSGNDIAKMFNHN
tara:strand:- start:40 stop:1134 length:1095 start_codon:yes stop_codon:yes gene_type:complete